MPARCCAPPPKGSAARSLGAVIAEIPAEPKILDLVASRRLAFAAAQKNVTAILVRLAAEPDASAAETRWIVRAARSSNNDEWGAPVFAAELTRNRHGRTGNWVMEWNSDDGIFREPDQAAHSGAVAAASADRPAQADAHARTRGVRTPLVVVAKIDNALRLTAVDRKAARSNLAAGMTLADARAMIPDLEIVEADEDADRTLLEAIADWCDRYTPLVALDLPHGLLLDVTGATALFGGERVLLDGVKSALKAAGFCGQAALAGTSARRTRARALRRRCDRSAGRGSASGRSASRRGAQPRWLDPACVETRRA